MTIGLIRGQCESWKDRVKSVSAGRDKSEAALALALNDNRHLSLRIERLELDLSQAQADLRRAVEVNGALAVRKSDPLAALLAADPHAEIDSQPEQYVDTPGATAADIAEKIATALSLRGEDADRKD